MTTATDKQRKALGKGLSALLPPRPAAALPAPAPNAPTILPVENSRRRFGSTESSSHFLSAAAVIATRS